MSYILFIILNVLFPIFMPVAAGFFIHRKFQLNTDTLTKVQFYILIPAYLFTNMYKVDLDRQVLFQISGVLVGVFISVYLVTSIIAKLIGYEKLKSNALVNAACLFNSGNYCIPLISLLYQDPFALSVQVIIMFTQNILLNVFGIFNANVGKKSIVSAIKDIFSIPLIYAVIIGGIFNYLNIPVYGPLMQGLEIAGQGLVAIALITLGAQLAMTKIDLQSGGVYLAAFLRLIVSPVIAGILLYLFKVEGLVASVVLICSGAPTAVNTVLLAIEFKNEPAFASQTVFATTLFSTLTIPIVIYAAQVLF